MRTTKENVNGIETVTIDISFQSNKIYVINNKRETADKAFPISRQSDFTAAKETAEKLSEIYGSLKNWKDYKIFIKKISGEVIYFDIKKEASPKGATEIVKELAELRDKELIHEVNLQGVDFSNIDLSYRDLSEFNFSGSNLSRACFTGSKLIRTRWIGANLSQADFRNSSGYTMFFENANLKFATLRRAHFDGAYFKGSDLSDVDASYTSFERCTFNDANLSYTNFSYGSLCSKSRIEKAKSLVGADINGVRRGRRGTGVTISLPVNIFGDQTTYCMLNNFVIVADEDGHWSGSWEQFLEKYSSDESQKEVIGLLKKARKNLNSDGWC